MSYVPVLPVRACTARTSTALEPRVAGAVSPRSPMALEPGSPVPCALAHPRRVNSELRCRTPPFVHGVCTPGPGPGDLRTPVPTALEPQPLTPFTPAHPSAPTPWPVGAIRPRHSTPSPANAIHPRAPTPRTLPAAPPTSPHPPHLQPTRPSTPPQTPANLVDTPSAHAFHSTLVHGNVVRLSERPGTVACRRRAGVLRCAAT